MVKLTSQHVYTRVSTSSPHFSAFGLTSNTELIYGLKASRWKNTV